MLKYILLLISVCTCLGACEKDITLDLAQNTEKIVVEGYIEQDQPPVVLLSHDISLYGSIDTASLRSYYIKNASVVISDGQQTFTLFDTGLGLYTSFLLKGIIGKAYTITIKVNGKVITGSTTIPHLVKLDSIHFERNNDTSKYGTLRCHLSDPDTAGNCYRFFAKRINKIHGDKKFVSSFNTIYNDQVVNGKSFDFYLRRGSDEEDTSTNPLDKRGFYKIGDTIVLKWCSIDKAHYNFWRTLQISESSNGNPFASPITIQGNLKGALGVWGGYAASYDTVIAK